MVFALKTLFLQCSQPVAKFRTFTNEVLGIELRIAYRILKGYRQEKKDGPKLESVRVYHSATVQYQSDIIFLFNNIITEHIKKLLSIKYAFYY